MRNPGASGVLTALLLAVASVFAWRVSPLATSVDDHVRLYFGGYVGAAQLRGGVGAAALRAELQRTTLAIADEYLVSRFVTAQTPYSPLTMVSVASAEAMRRLLRPRRVLPWILAERTLLWALMLALALRARARLPACPLAWFLVVALALSWMHAHTSPLYAIPRSFACLFTGLALALGATGTCPPWAAAGAVLASFAHPYSQAMNLAVVLPAAAIVAGTPAAPALRPRAGLVLATVAIVSLGAALAVLYVANPRSVLGVGAILGESATVDVGHNWEMSRTLLQRLSVALGLPLTGLVFRYAGLRRAALVGALFLATLLAASLLAPAGHYPTEYLSRTGAAWSAFLFGLCLRGDLLPDLASLSWRRRGVVTALAALVALPAAVPQAIDQPWGGRPEGIHLSPVEIECLRILKQSSGWAPATWAKPG